MKCERCIGATPPPAAYRVELTVIHSHTNTCVSIKAGRSVGSVRWPASRGWNYSPFWWVVAFLCDPCAALARRRGLRDAWVRRRQTGQAERVPGSPATLATEIAAELGRALARVSPGVRTRVLDPLLHALDLAATHRDSVLVRRLSAAAANPTFSAELQQLLGQAAAVILELGGET